MQYYNTTFWFLKSPKSKGSSLGDNLPVRIQQTKSKNIPEVNWQWEHFLDQSKSSLFPIVVRFILAELFVFL